MTDTIKKNSIDKVLGDFIVYTQPDYFKPGSFPSIDYAKINKEKIEKYYQLINAINQIYTKVVQYELYFSDFYPPAGKIKNFEALEYHIHSYLEDLTILKNKLQVFLGVLKNDLKKIASNAAEVEQALSVFITKIENAFADVNKHRGPHHHKGSKFLDSDLVDVRTFDLILQEGSYLQSLLRPEAVEEVRQRAISSFDKAKQNWVERARKNSEQMTGLVNHVIDSVKGWMYGALDITPVKELLEK